MEQSLSSKVSVEKKALIIIIQLYKQGVIDEMTYKKKMGKHGNV